MGQRFELHNCCRPIAVNALSESFKVNAAFKAVVMPNPNTGDFVMQLQLPKDKATDIN
ncbi:MAG TPA: hypothetical protein VEV83_20210 [Parafilimonas sp.]|nr:hypothetical protein [Parafilimonas sp.]